MNNNNVRQVSVIPDRKEEYGCLKGKKLLLLGGGSMMKEFVVRAKKMGIYTYVMGLETNDTAKELCDCPILGNAKDVDEVVELCKKEHIDGITTGYVDILLQTCHDACKELNFPFFANNKIIDIATNKDHFKKVCSKYNVPVPETYSISDIESKSQLSKIKYPVFIKPIDNSGSRGAYVCNDENEFLENYKKALIWSPTKTISIEEYLSGQDIILDYLVMDGEAYLVSIFDRFVTADRKPPINSPNIQFAPSKSLDTFLTKVDPNIKKMIKGMGLKNGIVFFQGYDNGGDIKLFEMGCRMGASFFSIEEAFIGVNPLDVLIHYALTGKMTRTGDFSLITPKYNGIGCAIYFLLKEGTEKIEHIYGIEDLWNIPYVEHVNLHNHEKDLIKWDRTIDVRVLTIYIAAPNKEQLRKTILRIYDKVKFTDADGESILAPVYLV